ncbi:MAG TPA: acyltransferase family protein [Micromonosporaceae bacterium]|nr:acyltransferase family protein [Micromonosporaceae bacterium]
MGPTVRATGTAHAGSGPVGSRFRPDIEGMRAVAVILVVLYHAGITALGGGYVGVDVFFVISGFLITTKLFGELSTSGTVSVTRFWARRATRLLPASVLVLVSTLIAAWLWLPPTRFPSISMDGITAALYAVNWRLAMQGVDYLNVGAPPSPLQHFWSLAVEEQFYLLWPLLLLALVPLVRRRTASRPGPTGSGPARAPIVVALLVVGAASFAASVLQTREAAPWAYFGAHTRAWELALGALIALGAAELARLPRVLAAAATWLGLAAVLTAAVWYTDATPFPGYVAALPVLGAGLMIAGGCAFPALGVGVLFRYRPFQEVGRLSYGWYLWHWPVITIAPVALGRPESVRLNLALAAASLVLAVVSFRLVEDPLRTSPTLRAFPRRGISFGLALSASAAVLAVVGGQLPMHLRPGGQPDAEAVAAAGTAAGDPRATVADAADPAAALAGLLQTAAASLTAPARLRPPLERAAADLPRVYRDGCHLSFDTDKVNRNCVYGDVGARTTVVLFGDSHAAQWFPALERIAKDRRWRLISYTKSACPAASVPVRQGELKRPYTECERWRDRALTAVRAMNPAMVVFANLNTDFGGLVDASADPDQTWIDGWLVSVNRVRQAGTKVVVLSDTPFPPANVPDCVSTNLADVTRCAHSQAAALAQPRRRSLLAEAATLAGATVVDPAPWFCTATICPVIVGNVLVYKDASHISTAYADLLAPVLAARLP